MKVTVVPAQVTTVEDKITGNLSLSQIALFCVPVFGGSLLYAALPPSMGYMLYKLIIIGVVSLIALGLSIRIKGKIVLQWLFILLRFHARPRLYLFTKNTTLHREDYPEAVRQTEVTMAVKEKKPISLPKLDPSQRAYLYAKLDDPISRLKFETTKKGGLNVRISETD